MTNDKPVPKKQSFWLIYLSLLISGLMLLGDAYNFLGLNRWTAKLGIALLYVLLALAVGKEKPAAAFGIAIVVVTVLITIII